MSRLLEYRIAKLEKQIANEAKQVGTLYHVCTLKAYLKYIQPYDQLSASGSYYNYVYGGSNYVSFTRDQSFVLDQRADDIVLVQIVVDGNKLSENYKVGPYNDFAFGEDGERKEYDDPIKREMEEAVKGPIKHLSRYVKEIRFDIAACHDLTKEKDLWLLKKHESELSDLVYYKFLRGKSADLGITPGTLLPKALEIMDVWYDDERNQEQLFSYDLRKIKKAIENGADVNKKHSADGYPLAFYADDDENIQIIKTLLRAGANPDIAYSDSVPVISYAIDNWCDEIIKLFIKNGADINIKDSNGATPLFHAVNDGNEDITKLLIRSGADVNVADRYDTTPLMLASKSGERKVARMLLNAGADVNAMNKSNETALSLSTNRKLSDMLIEAGANE